MKITGVSQVSHMAMCVKLGGITHFTSLRQTEPVMNAWEGPLRKSDQHICLNFLFNVIVSKEGPIILAEIR